MIQYFWELECLKLDFFFENKQITINLEGLLEPALPTLTLALIDLFHVQVLQ